MTASCAGAPALATPGRRPSCAVGTVPTPSYRRFLGRASLTLFAVIILGAFLMPLAYMVPTAFKDQASRRRPARRSTRPPRRRAPTRARRCDDLRRADRRRDAQPGARREGPRVERLHRPGRPERRPDRVAGPLADPRPRPGRSTPKIENFATAWEQLNFPRLLFNTAAIAVLSTIGAVVSSSVVAYGFSRFRFPGRNPVPVLLATIILPLQVTLIPQYVVFTRLGWTGTWLPLIVPHFFANAYNVFLLRQYFLTIPRDLDEAAMIDGAGPFRILRSVIMPQAMPAIVAVTLFHFFFAWNDFFLPLALPRRQARPAAAVDRHPAVQRPLR